MTAILYLLEDLGFYEKAKNILDNLYIPPLLETGCEERVKTPGICTPSLIKNVAVFIYNLYLLAEDKISESLQEFGLVKLLFR